MENSDESDIENECPICFEDIVYFVPCKNNHRICNACYTKLHKECPWEQVSCPLCRIKISPKSSWKNTIKIILEEIEVNPKNKQTYLNQFHTAYSIMECTQVELNIKVIRSLRDIIYNLIENDILDVEIIHEAVLCNVPIFIIDACINKYKLEYEDMNPIIIDAIIGGVRTNIILYLLEKYDFISFNYLFVADFLERKSILEIAIESNSSNEILDKIIEINPDSVMFKGYDYIPMYKLARNYGYEKKIVKKLKKLYFKKYKKELFEKRMNYMKYKLNKLFPIIKNI